MKHSRAIAVVLACAVSGAVAVWLSRPAHLPLADPARVPGLLELVAALAAATRPAVPLAGILTAWHLAAVAAAAALVALAVWRFTRSVLAATAMGLVSAASPLMAPALAPPDATALAVAAAAAYAFLDGRRIAGSVAVIIAVAIAPPLGPTSGVSAGVDRIAGILSSAGPLACVLAALGVFAVFLGSATAIEEADQHRRRVAVALGFPAVSIAAAFFSGAEPSRVTAPLVVSLWMLAGLGISEIIARSSTRLRAPSGVVVAAVLVAIHLQPRIQPPPSAAAEARTFGYETLTRRHFQELLYQIPQSSSVVGDDAITSILLRSLDAALSRSRNDIRVVSGTLQDVTVAQRSGRVFAFPRAQSELQERGVRFVDDAGALSAGLAEVAAVLPCDPLTTSWSTASSAAGMTTLAIVAGDDAARGPIVLYTGSPAPIDAAPQNWPALALRGFYTRSYDRSQPERRQGLLDEVHNDGGPADHASVNAAYVARTELWRVPGAPRALKFGLSAPPSSVMATQLARGTGPIQICPVFPFPVRSFTKR